MTPVADTGPLPTPARRPPVLILLTVCFALLLFCMPLGGFDIWWHLKIGEWIVENARVPRTDLYTYGSLGMPYLDQHWGFQVYSWILYSIGGVPLLGLAKSAMVSAAVAAGMSSRYARTPQSLVALVWLLPICVLTMRNFVRPEIFALLSIALTLWILRASSERPRLLLILPLQQLIVINCHAVSIISVGVMGFFVLDRAWLRWRSQGVPLAGSGWKLEWLTLGAMALAGLISPYGVDGWLFPLSLFLKISVEREFWSSVTYELVSPLRFLTLDGLTRFFLMSFFVQIVLGSLTFLLAWRDRRVDLYRVLLFSTFTYLALSSQRNVNLFAVVGGTVSMWNLADWAAVRPRVQTWLTARRTELVIGGLLVILSLSVVTGLWHRVTNARRDFGLSERIHYYIHGPAQFAGREGMPKHAYVADFGQASLYVFHNGPEHLSFMDGRLEHPRRSTIEGYEQVYNQLADKPAMAAGDRSFLEIIAPGARSQDEWPAIVLDRELSARQISGMLENPDWRPVFIDRTGAVFLSRSIADRLGLPPASLAPIFAPRDYRD